MKTENRPPGALTLRDGTAIPVRPIEPADAVALRRLHSRLSARSSYLRFLHALSELSEAQAHRLAEVDGFDHCALVALDPEQPNEIIAVVRYAREPGTDRAELAALVEDRWQGRGLGWALLCRLVDAARERGIRVFCALILTENVRALKLLEALGAPERKRSMDREVEHLEVDLSESQGRARIVRTAAAPLGRMRR